MSILCQASTMAPFFLQHLLTSCLSYFDNFCNISNHLFMIIFIILICDQLFLMLLPYKCSACQHSFSNKLLENKVCTITLYNTIVHHQTTTQYKYNFCLYRERKNSYNLLYFDIHIVEVVWSQIQNIFEACLYTEQMSHIYIHYNLPACREWPIYII